MYSNFIKIFLCVLLSITIIDCDDGLNLESNSLNSQTNGILPMLSNSQLTGPEPRQITLPIESSRNTQGYSGYNLPMYAGGQPQSPQSSSSGGWFSMFRPGRRSSLTSRLRNLMNALFFRRDTSNQYLGSGSSYSLAYRQPPLGYSSGLSQPNNYLQSASSRYPVVFGNYPSTGGMSSPNWSNYKQWASSGLNSGSLPSLASQLSAAASSPSANYAWSSNLGNSGSYSQLGSSLGLNSLSALSSSSGSSPSVSSQLTPGSMSGTYGSSPNYQAAASNTYPSAIYAPQYANQRSSLNYKPLSAYSSGASQSSSPSSSSSLSSSSSSSSGSSSSSSSSYNNSGSSKPYSQ